MRATWLRRCVEEQLWFVAETAKSFGEQEGYERALAADPLRKALGPRAVEAILKGEAVVVPLQPTDQMIDASYARERKQFGVGACGLKNSAIYETLIQNGRLDTPGEAA